MSVVSKFAAKHRSLGLTGSRVAAAGNYTIHQNRASATHKPKI